MVVIVGGVSGDRGRGEKRRDEEGGRKGGYNHLITNDRTPYGHRPSHPYNAGKEHVGFSPTRQTLRAPRGGGGTKMGRGTHSPPFFL